MSDEQTQDQQQGTVILAGAASILICCGLGYWFDPFDAPYLSAGVLGLVASISVAIRLLLWRKPSKQ